MAAMTRVRTYPQLNVTVEKFEDGFKNGNYEDTEYIVKFNNVNVREFSSQDEAFAFVDGMEFELLQVLTQKYDSY